MKRFLFFLLIIIIAPLIGGLYGVIHDQLTYTISPEYYTKFKFYQFGLMVNGEEAIFPNPRLQVAAVGFMATWWMGIPIGLILGLTALRIKSDKQMLVTAIKALAITMLVAFTTGLIGLAYGKYFLADTGVDWWLPKNLIDKASFIAVGSMHNFSYMGGLTGVIAGIIFIKTRKQKSNLV